MSLLLDKLQKDGSTLTGLDGKNSPLYNGQTQYPKGLATSQLDLDGKTPEKYSGESQYIKGLEESQLDLNGKKPLAYDGQSQYVKGLEESQLDVGNIKAKYQFLASVRSANFVSRGFATSQLDLNGKTPAKYLDNPPR